MTVRPGIRHRNLQKSRSAAEMQLTNTILKKELREKWEETKELKALIALMDNSIPNLKDLDPEETIRAIRQYKAKRFN